MRGKRRGSREKRGERKERGEKLRRIWREGENEEIFARMKPTPKRATKGGRGGGLPPPHLLSTPSEWA